MHFGERFIVFAISLGLAGCIMPQPALNQNQNIAEILDQKKMAEESAWSKVKELSAAECGVGAVPPPREEAIKVSACVSRLVEVYVLPEAAFPEILIPNRREALNMAEEYAAGRMSPVEYKRLSIERLKKYHDTWTTLADSQRIQHAMALQSQQM
jgi:hypothetical protein